MEKRCKLAKYSLYGKWWSYLGQRRKNEEVFALANTSRKVIKTIKERELNFYIKIKTKWIGKLNNNGKSQWTQSKTKTKINIYKQHAIRKDGSEEVSGGNDTCYEWQKQMKVHSRQCSNAWHLKKKTEIDYPEDTLNRRQTASMTSWTPSGGWRYDRTSSTECWSRDSSKSWAAL